eukprot:3467421-Pleurochrysis_carterae.AAC.1
MNPNTTTVKIEKYRPLQYQDPYINLKVVRSQRRAQNCFGAAGRFAKSHFNSSDREGIISPNRALELLYQARSCSFASDLWRK